MRIQSLRTVPANCCFYQAINDKIKQLDFQDCKVRVLNVDSQASFDNILVSVIGEISNKSEPSRKFIQTFVLAEQPNGYYVLNDIFRYLVEDEEDLVHEDDAAPAEEGPKAAPEAAPADEAQVMGPAASAKVDEKLEKLEVNGEVEESKEVARQTNGTPAQEETPAPAPAVEEDLVNNEKPATPEPSPAPEQKEAPAAEKEQPAAPVKAMPKTWANIASKSGANAPVNPAIPVAPPKATPAPTPAAPADTPAAAPAASESAVSQESASNDGAGWQTAGHDHKKTQSRAGDEQTVQAYIKNVTDKVDAGLLKQTLSRYGKLKYLDISRPRVCPGPPFLLTRCANHAFQNCAFVEFAEPAGYTAAVRANPLQIGSEQIVVEERRRGNHGSNGYSAGRGGTGRGRGDRVGSQGRGGFQRDGRGLARGRGGNAAAKGRGQAQVA